MNFPEIPDHQIEKVLGAGGMAVVYLATHTTMGNKRAVKVMQQHLLAEEGFRGNFLNEGQIVAKLNHPNIVQIYDMKISGDVCYMSMEYLDNGTLKDKLKQHQFSVEESIYILQQVGAGLNHAHKHNYIHRDIKPANILFKSDGAIKLADFGISKLQNISGDLTLIGLSPGTPSYMCPEQRNNAQIDKRCDIYSLGLVFYEMLTGKKVVHSDTNTQAIFTHTLSPVLPPQYQYLQLTLNKALAKKAEDRYSSVPEFLNDLIMESRPKSALGGAEQGLFAANQQPNIDYDNAPTVISDRAAYDSAATVIRAEAADRPSGSNLTPGNTKKKSKVLPMVLIPLAILAGGAWYAYENTALLQPLKALIAQDNTSAAVDQTAADKAAADKAAADKAAADKAAADKAAADKAAADKVAADKVAADKAAADKAAADKAAADKAAADKAAADKAAADKAAADKAAADKAAADKVAADKAAADKAAADKAAADKAAADKAAADKAAADKALLATLEFAEPGKRLLERKAKIETMAAKVIKLLEIQPDNEQAVQYKNKLLDAQYALASDFVKFSNPDEAASVIAMGLKVAPADERFSRFKDMLEQSQRQVKDSEKIEIDQLLAIAEQRFLSGNLSTPQGGSALEAYREILLINPHNDKAKAGVNDILSAYETRIGVLIDTDLKAANTVLNEALEFFPFNESLISHQNSIKEKK